MKNAIALFMAGLLAAFFLFPVAALPAAGDGVRADRHEVKAQMQEMPAALGVSIADLKRLNRFSTRPGFVVPMTVSKTMATLRTASASIDEGYKDDPHIA